MFRIMRERILTVALVIALGVIAYDRFALHLIKTLPDRRLSKTRYDPGTRAESCQSVAR